jgi:hypothetical protein
MDKFQRNIDKQIEFNKGKNLFCDDAGGSLRFIRNTIQAIESIDHLSEDFENFLMDYAAEKALREFWRVNQYFSFNNQAKHELRSIYTELFSSIKSGKIPVETLSKVHYQNLKSWLQKTNPGVEHIYQKNDMILEAVPCSEYSAGLQVKILHIDMSNIMEPVLDIGCGKQATMVNYLRSIGIDAHGIDRFANDLPYIENQDWLEFNYETENWGTIMSNIGFSNHFYHHHLKENGNFMGYAVKYMEIVNSLKIGGCFYYSPDLPFIEQFLDKDKFHLKSEKIENLEFNAMIIKRIR